MRYLIENKNLMFAQIKYLLQIGLLLLIASCATESSTQLTNINSSDEVSAVRELAEIKNISKEDLIKKTTENFNKLFFN